VDVGEGEEERLEMGGDGVIADLPEFEEEFDGFVAERWMREERE